MSPLLYSDRLQQLMGEPQSFEVHHKSTFAKLNPVGGLDYLGCVLLPGTGTVLGVSGASSDGTSGAAGDGS